MRLHSFKVGYNGMIVHLSIQFCLKLADCMVGDAKRLCCC